MPFSFIDSVSHHLTMNRGEKKCAWHNWRFNEKHLDPKFAKTSLTSNEFYSNSQNFNFFRLLGMGIASDFLK